MKRRTFIAGLGSAAAWPLGARGQQGERMRRVGVLMGFEESNLEAKAFLSAFTQGLAELGWADGRNLQMDVRWTAANVERALIYAKELVDLQPDVIFVSTDPATDAIQRETRTIPIVFAFANDFDAGLPQPGANITGFLGPQASLADKWLELLTGIAPGVKRVAIAFNPNTAPGGGSFFLPSLEAAARTRKVEPIAVPVHSDAEIETVSRRLGGSQEAASSSCRVVLWSSIARQSYCTQPEIAYRRSISYLSLAKMAVCFPTVSTTGMYIAARPPMWTAFSAAQSRRTSPFNCQSSLSCF